MYDSKKLFFFVVPLSTNMKNKFNLRKFFELYPNEQACLDKVFELRYGELMCCPKCAVIDAKFYKVKKRRCYACGECGHHIYPIAGTIMFNSTVPLNLWFYAIYLFSVSKNGISSNELSRTLGISYVTAHKMSSKIRSIMKDEPTKLHGTVHVDESYYGAKGRIQGWGGKGKTILFGMIERKGRVIIKIVPDRRTNTLIPVIKDYVERNSKIHSDKWESYEMLPFLGYKHRIKGENWANTNCIEGYWGNLKKSLRGTHKFISVKYLQSYIDEHSFRHNHRHEENLFEKILSKIGIKEQELPIKSKEQAVIVIQQLRDLLRS